MPCADSRDVSYLVMCSLGEMAAYLPHKKGFSGYVSARPCLSTLSADVDVLQASRFVDPALGFALGWNYLVRTRYLESVVRKTLIMELRSVQVLDCHSEQSVSCRV